MAADCRMCTPVTERMVKMSEGRRKIIPDRIFDQLWQQALTACDEHSYIHGCMYGSRRFNYAKYRLDYVEAVEMLAGIYKAAHTGFPQLIKKAGVGTAAIAHTFCIPVRTVENWKSGKADCAPYIRLMILRYYHLINLGKYIYCQSEISYLDNRPSVYSK